ncbi:hypothetical protein ACIBL3_18685 [Kribbella sp. NPDC050124]|uniref:hypothetical protein n=1 Tax=Kribbella sp. NPDC050124 TaxID=3364114 RepID=UPI0037A3D30B
MGGLGSAGTSLAPKLIASEIVYGEGVAFAVIVVVFAFLFVAYTDGYWFVGTGLLVALVSAIFIMLAWHSLADYPLTYRDGDRPVSKTSGSSLYETWELGSGASIGTTFVAGDAADIESLAGKMWLEYGCPDARVDWRIQAGDDVLASGTLREGDEREMEDVPVQLDQLPVDVKVTAERKDSADCATRLLWQNAGFEGPGHGKFRFVFPIPDA